MANMEEKDGLATTSQLNEEMPPNQHSKNNMNSSTSHDKIARI